MDLNKLNLYFNRDLNIYLYNVKDSERFYTSIESNIGSFYRINIKRLPNVFYETSFNIIKYISDNLDKFKDAIYPVLKLTFSINSTNVLEDTIRIGTDENSVRIGFYVCYGIDCPINFNSVIMRSGIIPYFKLNDQIFVILGIKIYIEGNVYSDFGGGCKVSLKELSYNCASRELREESLGLIGPNSKITHIFSTKTEASGILLHTTRTPRRYISHQMLYFVDYTEKLVEDTLNILDISTKYKEL